MDLQTEISRRGVFCGRSSSYWGAVVVEPCAANEAAAAPAYSSQNETNPKFRATLSTKEGEIIASTHEAGISLLEDGESAFKLRDVCSYHPNRDGSVTADYEVQLIKTPLISPYTNKTDEIDETYAKVKTSFTYFLAMEERRYRSQKQRARLLLFLVPLFVNGAVLPLIRVSQELSNYLKSLEQAPRASRRDGGQFRI